MIEFQPMQGRSHTRKITFKVTGGGAASLVVDGHEIGVGSDKDADQRELAKVFNWTVGAREEFRPRFYNLLLLLALEADRLQSAEVVEPWKRFVERRLDGWLKTIEQNAVCKAINEQFEDASDKSPRAKDNLSRPIVVRFWDGLIKWKRRDTVKVMFETKETCQRYIDDRLNVSATKPSPKPKVSPDFFIACSSGVQQPFFKELVIAFLNEASVHELDLVPKFPTADYAIEAQDRLLTNILANKSKYKGGFVVPVKAAGREGGLVKFIGELDLPTVFLDVRPFHNRSYPRLTTFVGYDNVEGGRIAAEAMRYELTKTRPEERWRVLVMASEFQKERQDAFAKQLGSAAEVIIDDQGRLDRVRAETRVIGDLNRHGPGSIHGIFCTNDVMAIGAVNALRRMGLSKEIVVIGYDGVIEAVQMIESGDTPLKNTVVQDTEKLALKAVLELQNLILRKSVSDEHMLTPRLLQDIPVIERPTE